MAGLVPVGSSRPVFAPGPKTLTFSPVAGSILGDLLMIVVAYDPADGYVIPVGWSRIAHLVGTEAIDVLVHSVELDERANVVLALTTAAKEWQGQIMAWRGGSPGVVLEASAIGNFAAAVQADAPTVNTQQAISFELCAWSVTNATVPVPPAGFTAVDRYASALATSRSFAVAYAIANATGALPVRTAACNPATGSGISLVLRDRTPVIPAVLFDPVPGNIGLRQDEHSSIMLRLAEPDGVLPSDSVENLFDLQADVGTVAPLQVSTWTGYGRRFRQAVPNGLLAADQENPDGNLHSLLQRDVTVQAIIALTLAGAAGPQTIIARGINDGSLSERYCYGLEIEEQAAHPGCVEVRWFWQDAAGTIHTQPAGVFSSPGDGNFFLLTATRRWEATGRVVTRYYVGGEQIAELVTANGDVSGGTTGHTTVGGRKAAAAWGRFLNADLDELSVVALELSAEEIRETHRRLSEHQPAGVETFVGLMPPGAPWYDNPANDVGKFVKLAGQSIGTAVAETERMRALWLPDAAPIDQIARWESLCGLPAKPSDSLDTRRARVIAYLSRDNGFSIPEVQQALSTTLATVPDDIQILEFENTITDDFATLNSAERWLVGDVGTWGINVGELEVTALAGADLRWEPTRAQSFIRLPLPSSDGILTAQIKLSTYWASLPANTIVGLFLFNRVSNNALWFGVKTVGGVRKLGYQAFVAGVLGAFVPLVDPSLDQSYWLRITSPAGEAANTGRYVFSWSTTGPSSGFASSATIAGLPNDVEWAGVAAMSTDAALAANLDATFDDFTVRCPNGLRPFNWYAYRDPALGGSPDMHGANLVARRIKPAHTYGAATDSKSVLCDDPLYGLCDRGPCGGI